MRCRCVRCTTAPTGSTSSMKAPRLWVVAGLLVLVLHISSILVAGGATGKVDDKARRKRRAAEEVGDDAVFAAAVLGLVHDRVRDVGNIFRIVGDTAGAVTGGTIKAVGATVNGLSSVIDAASRGVDTKSESESRDQHPSGSAPNGDPDFGGAAQIDEKSRAAPPESDESQPSQTSPHERKDEKGGSNIPDPIDRIESVTRSSLAGSLRFVSAAVRGVGDAVFQAGAVAEGLAGGTGQVAEDLVRVVQGVVGWARDDMLEFNTRNNLAHDAGGGGGTEGRHEEGPPGAAPATPSSEMLSDNLNQQTPSSSLSSSSAAAATMAALTAQKAWRGILTLARVCVKAVLLEVAALFRRSHGALPPAPRFAVLLLLALVIWSRGRRRRSPPPPPPPLPPLPSPPSSSPSPSPRQETAAPGTPQRDSSSPQAVNPAVQPGLEPGVDRTEVIQGPPTAVAAAAAGLFSPSRSLLVEARFPGSPAVAVAVAAEAEAVSPVRWRVHDGPDGLDPSLPSPAQVRAAQVRTGPAQNSMLRGMARRHRARHVGEVAVAVEVEVEVERRGNVTARKWRWGWDWDWDWGWGWWWGWTRFPERWIGGSRRYWLWLVLLWLVASVLEERERDRVAWLAWDEGFRRGQASRAVDPTAQAETVAWINHLVDGVWGGQGKVARVGGDWINGGGGALDGLSSFVSERVAESILEALEEMKPTSVVGVELQDVDLGSSSPQILGVKMLDPTSATSPGGGDGKCTREGECVSLRVDLAVATQGLRLGVGVKVSSLEKALLPTGTVRLLEVFFRGSVAIRAELRKEFPFVGTTLVAVDGVPEMRVRLEKWGLDALTLGAVDEWARIGLQQAIRPFVLPRFLEVDAAYHICPECPPVATEIPANYEGQNAGDDTPPGASFGLPFSHLTAASAAGWMVHPPELKRSRSSGGGPGSSKASPRTTETNADSGRRLGKGKVKNWDPGSSSQGRSAAAPAFEVEGSGSGGVGRMTGSSPTAKVSEGGSPREKGGQGGGGGGADRLKSGRAAAMSDLYEYRGGMGGALQWLKDRVSDKITGGNGRKDRGRVVEWEEMD